MGYVKTEWKNREVERSRTFMVQNNADGTITLIPAEGTIIEPGTPIIASTMNNMENAIELLDANSVPYTGTTKDLDMNKKSLLGVNNLKFADMNNDLINFQEFESSFDGKLKRGSYNADGTLKKIIYEQTTEGIITLPNQSYVEVYKSTSQSIASSTNVKITSLLESVDRQDEFTADAIIVKEQGIYALYGMVDWAAFTANRISLKVYLNGAYAFDLSEHSTASAITTSSIGTVIKNLLAGDKIEFYAYQNNGGAFNITAARFRVVKIA